MNLDRDSLLGRRIAITGAASGIGLATTRLFAARGARVALLDREASVAQAAASFPNAVHAVVNVTDSDSVEAGVAAVGEAMAGIDGLVNAAGADFSGSILETTPEDWNRVLAVNLTGPFNVIRAALPWLRKEPRATIVNVSSGLGLRPIPNRSAYVASKAGLINLSKGLAMEFAPHINVNVVCPGVADTPMLRKAWPSDADIARILEKYLKKELPTAEDIAYSILFMTSDASRHITGVTLASDGGSSFH